MKTLILTDSYPDYLADDLLYGLRSMLGDDLVDFPKKEVLYKSFEAISDSSSIYGNGFHCFGLPDIEIDRSDVYSKVTKGYFDVIINSSAHRVNSPLHPSLVVVDGEDHSRLCGKYVNKVPLYFKRELFEKTNGVEPILFALPDFLFDDVSKEKNKLYHASFNVNTQKQRIKIAEEFPPDYSFASWADYLFDIKSSRFGISPKGAGYDCQRHYEILGQAVLCVYMDDTAPLGMKTHFRDGENCLHFSSAEELKEKIAKCDDYERILAAGMQDMKDLHLASRRATEFLDNVARSGVKSKKLSLAGSFKWKKWLSGIVKNINKWSPR